LTGSAVVSLFWLLSLFLPVYEAKGDIPCLGLIILAVGWGGSPAWFANILIFPGLMLLQREEKNTSGPIIISIALLICLYFALTYEGNAMGINPERRLAGFYVWMAAMSGAALLLLVRAISEGPVVDNGRPAPDSDTVDRG